MQTIAKTGTCGGINLLKEVDINPHQLVSILIHKNKIVKHLLERCCCGLISTYIEKKSSSFLDNFVTLKSKKYTLKIE